VTISWFASLILVAYLTNNYQACQHRITVTYLILAFTIFSMIAIQNWLPNKYFKYLVSHYWLLFALSIISLIVFYLAPIYSSWQILLFVIFITSLSLMISPLYKFSQHNGVLKSCLTAVIVCFLLLSLVSLLNPELISFKIGNILLVSLISLLILRISFYFYQPSNQVLKFASYFGIILFSVYTLYDTKLMIWRANRCQEKYNYLQNVISLFLDFINLFTNSMSLSNNK
jgi:FtsH-binding integral membrane protein